MNRKRSCCAKRRNNVSSGESDGPDTFVNDLKLKHIEKSVVCDERLRDPLYSATLIKKRKPKVNVMDDQREYGRSCSKGKEKEIQEIRCSATFIAP